MKIGQLIQAYIDEHDISLREFAKRSGITPAGVMYLIKGKNGKEVIPETATIAKVAKAMHLTVGELLECLNDEEKIAVNRISPDRQKAIETVYRLSDEEIKAFLLLFGDKSK